MSNLAAVRVVAAGAAFLDRQGPPNWRNKINTETLSLASSKHCVLGQIYGYYDTGLIKLGLTDSLSRAYGFVYGRDGDDFVSSAQLDEAWKDILKDVGFTVGQIVQSALCGFAKIVAKATVGDTVIYTLHKGKMEDDAFKETSKTSGFICRTQEELRTSWKIVPKAEYKPGDILLDQEDNFYFFESELRVWRLRADVSYGNTHGTLKYWQESGKTFKQSKTSVGGVMSHHLKLS